MTMILNSRKQGVDFNVGGGKSVDVAPCSNANQLGFTLASMDAAAVEFDGSNDPLLLLWFPICRLEVAAGERVYLTRLCAFEHVRYRVLTGSPTVLVNGV